MVYFVNKPYCIDNSFILQNWEIFSFHREEYFINTVGLHIDVTGYWNVAAHEKHNFLLHIDKVGKFTTYIESF